MENVNSPMMEKILTLSLIDLLRVVIYNWDSGKEPLQMSEIEKEVSGPSAYDGLRLLIEDVKKQAGKQCTAYARVGRTEGMLYLKGRLELAQELLAVIGGRMDAEDILRIHR